MFNRKANGEFAKVHGKKGFTKWQQWGLFGIVFMSVSVIGGGQLLVEPWVAENTKSTRERLEQLTPKVEAAEIETLSVEALEQKLIDIVWNGESKKHVPNGDVLMVFDPSQAMMGKCAQQFSRNTDCYSMGPMQIKLSTLQHYWPKLYGEEITQREALDVALDLQKSQRFFVDCAVKIKGCANNWTAFNNHKTEGQIYVDLIREVRGIRVE